MNKIQANFMHFIDEFNNIALPYLIFKNNSVESVTEHQVQNVQ